ncbi:MAG: hypothetical protein AAF564_26300 [Bacteroidota bacterium]
MEVEKARFGCTQCLPEDADAAGEALKQMSIHKALIQESHYSIKLRVCKTCQQAFVSVFTERTDWQDGKDPQRWLVMPLTTDEVTRLSALQEISALERSVQLIAPDRRSLCLDYPKGHPSKVFWPRGLRIGIHD